MPQMDWNSFQDAHDRPHLVIANLEDSTEILGETDLSVLAVLAEALGVIGNYAVTEDGNALHAAFERDIDAERFSKAIMARATISAPQWASQSIAHLNRSTQRKIATALKQLCFPLHVTALSNR